MNTMQYWCTVAQWTVYSVQGTHGTYDDNNIIGIIPIFHQFDKQNDIEILLCRE